MKPKHQRLTLAIAALVAVLVSGVLAMSAIEDKASYFYAPADVARAKPADGRAIRLGGMVMTGSLKTMNDGTLSFMVHDESNRVPVRFKGVAPDLFKEGSGVVAEGSFANGVFVADTLLAKHDERYMPPEQSGAQHKTATLTQ